MKTSIHNSLALFGVIFFLFSSVYAAPPLTREIAAELAAEAEQIRKKDIAVGPIRKVRTKTENGEIATEGVQVMFIAPKVVETTIRRVACYRTFFYDPEWGWYTYVLEEIRGGDRFDVVSQKGGRFEIR